MHESASGRARGPSNERLEFFGDSILGFVTARWLCERYPEANEGELHRRKAAIVSGEAWRVRAPARLRRAGPAGRRHRAERRRRQHLDPRRHVRGFFGRAVPAPDSRRVARFLEAEHLERIDSAESAERRSQDRPARVHPSPLRRGPDVLRARRGAGPRPALHLAGRGSATRIVGEGIGASKKAAQQSAAAMALAYLRNRHPEPEPPAAAEPPRLIGRSRDRAPPLPQTYEGTLSTDATQVTQSLRIQDLCRNDGPRFRHRASPPWSGRTARASRTSSMRSAGSLASRARESLRSAEARGRDLRRQRASQTARHGRGDADLGQRRRLAADRLE